MKLIKRRPGTIYAIRTARRAFNLEIVKPATRLGYVGKTTQRPYTRRIDQHLKSQPWSDLIASHHVLWQGVCTPFGLWWREIYYILTRFPVYNYQWNRLNPRRIPVYRAAAERSARQHYYGGRMWTR